ncbi:hypothetical protein [Saccharopolyspora endophytica]|uniref:Carboxypeptidase regulatory-like domain-containing protein n=1 Tax=Saccharopolyspora endophytica TaxID=543886 RepID=A0ABS5D8W5_9PSEU|nr:hypothetical protein [Saccharopolyspora endophytica]MBQ0922715.1 hypothetical protein [Saccharopolyspora endophytica]
MKQRIPAELRRLRELFQAQDPVPDRVLAGSYAAVAMRAARGDRGELKLVGDSADERIGVRAGGSQSRVLTFAMPGRVLEMDVVPTAAGLVRVSGMVLNRSGQAPPTGEVVVRHPSGERSGELDRDGAFQVADVPRGPVSVVFRPERAEPAIADWLVC